ncbi:MAG: 16S rRNA (cytidine(1402)-2'-O)-methyltransferase [Nitriliruptorales bacterium]|nr:16S rRNA (cytidine(1402)-2'-O)-methyltransferase [Nitriliruptorales bacterium]
MATGVLVVVATPIGNLADLSPRAADALRTADLVLAEDTRRTATLMRHVGSSVRMRALHDHNEDAEVDDVVARLAAGATIVLVSDAGTPTVSDPGVRVIRAASAAGMAVSTVPGPSAVLAALSVAGLPTDRFVFEGFLPRRGAVRTARLEEIARETRTIVVFVSVHRAGDDLADLADAMGRDRAAVACRELTKLHEEIVSATLGELADRVGSSGLKGELTLVIAGAEPAPVPGLDRLVDEVRAREAAGQSRRDAVRTVAEELGVSRRKLYQAVLGASPEA